MSIFTDEEVVTLFVIALIVLLIGYGASAYSCSVYGDTTGRESKFNFSGCFVKHNDQWYAQEEYKFIALQSK
jgi:hypothetical protein